MANKRFLAGLAAAALLVGCGENPTADRTGTTSSTGYTAGSSIPNSYAGTSSSVYGTVPTASTATSATGSVAATASVTPTKAGIEATITDRQTSGIFTKSLKAVTVSVANHDGATVTRFLLVVFSKKGAEVDVQYKTITMNPGMTTSYTFQASKDADDATVEVRDTLL